MDAHMLTQIEALNLNIIVPGHGPVGTSADIVTMQHYLADMQQLVTQAIEQGALNEQNVDVPAPYTDWEGANTFTDNLLFLYKQTQNRE